MNYLASKIFGKNEQNFGKPCQASGQDDLLSFRKLEKETLSNLLLKNDKRYSALRLRPYFMRLNEINFKFFEKKNFQKR